MSEPSLNQSPSNVIPGDFAHRRPSTNSTSDEIVKVISREVRRHKITYNQLKRIFMDVRSRCDLKVPKKKETLVRLPSSEQLQIFFNAIENPVHKLLIKTLLGTGLRVSELCNIQVSQIDFAKNQMFVHQGKGAKDRIVVFSNHLKSHLQLFLSDKRNRYLFESERSNKFTPRRIQQIFDRYSKKSQIYMHPHLCRHIFATTLAQAGLTEDQRSVLCGHSKGSNIQQTYTHLAMVDVAEQAISALDKNNL
jgi:integrase